MRQTVIMGQSVDRAVCYLCARRDSFYRTMRAILDGRTGRTVVLDRAGRAPWRLAMWRARAMLGIAAEYGTFWPTWRKE